MSLKVDFLKQTRDRLQKAENELLGVYTSLLCRKQRFDVCGGDSSETDKWIKRTERMLLSVHNMDRETLKALLKEMEEER